MNKSTSSLLRRNSAEEIFVCVASVHVPVELFASSSTCEQRSTTRAECGDAPGVVIENEWPIIFSETMTDPISGWVLGFMKHCHKSEEKRMTVMKRQRQNVGKLREGRVDL
jgi:hypothetical protein